MQKNSPKKTLAVYSLYMIIGAVCVVSIFVGYVVYSEYIHLKERYVEVLFQMIILALSSVIGIGLFWGFFVGKAARELSVITDFLKSKNGDGFLDLEGGRFSISEFEDIAASINAMLKEIRAKNEELVAFNEHLESKVEEKTKALLLTNEELRCAKTRADKALASRDKFIKDSIHEINTPLNVIQANIELLRLGGINNKNLVKIEAASKIISAIYDDLSYFIKKDRFLVKKEVINFSDFLSSRLEYFKEVAEGANIKIVQKITEQLFVSFDITQLQRMCDNNIFNAVKYSKEGSEIRVSLYMSGCGKIVFEIINQAVYRPDIGKIFNRFYRGLDARGGFGIGLSLVYQIAVQNNVTICCSALDDGLVWFSYAFKDFFDDAFSSHGF